jgi:hypothetical protein
MRNLDLRQAALESGGNFERPDVSVPTDDSPLELIREDPIAA